ncbi:Hypothetical protein SRAE_1000169200 [Strongyloides ratti]|uniref:Uncharacterized protein n=1 Tax=Strongyloides ratti TaxID=34506 RepID=A0A090L0W5_STRRB|nr:Hypothetical protein SRAE_1000169200 [Strongyloides ratti]CEF63430.1 Hypothetical protein SRAE_1000169200 [Strongyloides ratti]
MDFSYNDSFSELDNFSNIQCEFNGNLDSCVGSPISYERFSNKEDITKGEQEQSNSEYYFCMECREALAYKYVLKEKCCEELKEWLVNHTDILNSWESTHEGYRRYPLNKYEEDFYEFQLKEKVAPNCEENTWKMWKHCFVDDDFRGWEIEVPNLFYNEGDPQFVKHCGGENSRFVESRESIESWIFNVLEKLSLE